MYTMLVVRHGDSKPLDVEQHIKRVRDALGTCGCMTFEAKVVGKTAGLEDAAEELRAKVDRAELEIAEAKAEAEGAAEPSVVVAPEPAGAAGEGTELGGAEGARPKGKGKK